MIVGAGFAGLYMLHRLRGMGFTARVFEAGSGVGGTWYWNRYPGARCDVESMEYSYQFSDELQQEWEWSERYAAQPEILRYANHVADRFDLRRDIQFNTRVTPRVPSTRPRDRWAHRDRRRRAHHGQRLHHGDRLPLVAEHAEVRGRSRRSRARRYHTGHWPHEGVDFTGKRVGGHRHRLVGRAVDPDHRRAGGAAVRVPAHGELRRAGAQRAARPARYAAGDQGRLCRPARARQDRP